MKKHILIGLMALAFAAPAFAEEAAPAPAAPEVAPAAAAPALVPARRELIVSADGVRVGNVLGLNDDGSPRVIFQQQVMTIPLSTLSRTDDNLVTSLTRRELMAMREY